ncbi:SMP-30/gluconolactonase/LRE family protein [Fontisphaera persica]|uniref:SMP-30/gluconolactonase/LRE family protein n=1 Tax=Fontisphaera persica TaxID=2974023 RepID=UPI0024BFADF9|nr:SMP-30/gluconolactonase/LRE family protein [Fontisphaera persica]WCJ59822.1 SMP-30/gluconolactonase/LRE family protein [Fontisphaera persica]
MYNHYRKAIGCLAALMLALGQSGAATNAPAKSSAAKTKPAVKKEAVKTAKPVKPAKPTPPPVADHVERLDPAINALLPTNTFLEPLASGFIWSEGPVWMGKYLLFSDVPTNRIYKWEEGLGISVFLEPSGYTGTDPRGGEMGSNGLTRDRQGRLVICQHGDRRVSRLEKDGSFTPLAQYYQWRRFNSPNDAVFDSKGNLYFTDPPYGLPAQMADPRKEIPFQGIYRVSPQGEVTLLSDKLSRPNGIALSPDEKTLYVANSDRSNPAIFAFPINKDGTLGNRRIFFDASELASKGRPGLPDGLKVDIKGNVFATGPGGVLVLSPQGKHLGTIKTDRPTANCAWGNDGSVLYITANHDLLRVKTKTRGKLP